MLSRLQNAGRSIRQFLISEDGPTAVEYAVILALIFSACFATITLIGPHLQNSFSDSSNSIRAAGS